jgi:hypothetical protein
VTHLSWLSLICVLASSACGDDGGGSTPTPTDAGVVSKMDGGSSDKPTMIPRRDAQVETTPDPITECDRNNANACASDEVCDLLLRQLPDGRLGFYTGCVKATRERAEGDVCDWDLTKGDPYELPGLKDVVFRDPCGAGLVCATNRKVPGAFSCQSVCSSGQLGDAPYRCQDPTTLCAPASPMGISEFCRKSDGCSVEKQTGCLGREACYLVPSTDRKQLLTFCTSEPMTATADGAPGCSPVTCKPGSACLGPVRMPIASWTDGNTTCRPVCNGQMGQAPAADEDAGVPFGLCSATTRCEPYSASGLLLSSIPAPPFGQCEAQ